MLKILKNKLVMVTMIILLGLGYYLYTSIINNQNMKIPLGNFIQTYPDYKCNSNQSSNDKTNLDGGIIERDGNPCLSTSTITVEGQTVHYIGGISPDNIEHFNIVVKNLVTTPKNLKINSFGGDVISGMKMGSYIKDNNMNVEVYEVCFSSCANYIFQAGNIKLIHPDTVLGWHGDNTSSFSSVNSEQKKAEFKKMIKDQLPDMDAEQLDKMIEVEFRKITIEQPKMEKQFYEKYNIDPTANRYGHKNKKILKKLKGFMAGYGGWTFSPEIMEQLNIKNIKLVTGQWYPSEKNGLKLLYIDKLD